MITKCRAKFASLIAYSAVFVVTIRETGVQSVGQPSFQQNLTTLVTARYVAIVIGTILMMYTC